LDRTGFDKIGQAEVINFLKECDEPKTRTQIAEAIDCTPIRVSHIIKDLLKWKEVKFIEYDWIKASKLAGYTIVRRTRFYYVED